MQSFMRGARQLASKERQQQVTDFPGLFLLNPVPCSIQQITTAHCSAGTVLHPLDCSRCLINSPVISAGNKHRGNINRMTIENLQLPVANTLSAASVPL